MHVAAPFEIHEDVPGEAVRRDEVQALDWHPVEFYQGVEGLRLERVVPKPQTARSQSECGGGVAPPSRRQRELPFPGSRPRARLQGSPRVREQRPQGEREQRNEAPALQRHEERQRRESGESKGQSFPASQPTREHR